MTTQARSAVQPRYRPTPFPAPEARYTRRSDGTILMWSARPLPSVPELSFADFVPRWAERRGDLPAFCDRDRKERWRTISWAQLWQQVQAVGARLLELGLSQKRPLILLSGNSIEQATLLLAAEYAGIPSAPVSPAYSTVSSDFARLKGVRDLLDPAAIFVQDARTYTRAIEALALPGAVVIAVDNAGPGQLAWADLASAGMTAARRSSLAAAHAAIRPEDTARVLFTSGSTGVPKGVPTSYGNHNSRIAYFQDSVGSLCEPQPVFLDWLPWHHAAGVLLTLGRSVVLGAAHYIDDGRPVPGQFERTTRNLREVSPIMITNVPATWTMLAAEIERDPELARSLFARAVSFISGGASLPADTWNRVQRVAERTIGERIMFCSAYASTETTGGGTFCGWATDDLANIGLPMPGTEVKLVPLDGDDGRFEIRVRGGHNFAGYLKRPDLTRAAFDEEGFFRLGDAVRFADVDDPTAGMRYAGRTVEDFKLTNGTWVRTGAVRLELLEACAPLITDAVICGHDHDYVAALAWPNVEACRRIIPGLASASADEMVTHPALVAELRNRLSSQRGSTSMTVRRLLLMAEPPSMDANEIADKGYVNQAATRARRADRVALLLQRDPAPHVVVRSHD